MGMGIPAVPALRHTDHKTISERGVQAAVALRLRLGSQRRIDA